MAGMGEPAADDGWCGRHEFEDFAKETGGRRTKLVGRDSTSPCGNGDGGRGGKVYGSDPGGPKVDSTPAPSTNGPIDQTPRTLGSPTNRDTPPIDRRLEEVIRW